MNYDCLKNNQMQQRQHSEWTRGVRKEARSRLCFATISGSALFLLLVLAVHTAVTCFNELGNPINAETTLRATVWLQRICSDEQNLPSDAYVSCVKYRDWMSRSTAMNSLRIALHSEVDALQWLWGCTTGWLFAWDPFYAFHVKLIVNALCTSLSTAIPFLMLFGLLYIALLFKGPISQLKYWFCLQNSSHQGSLSNIQQPVAFTNTDQYIYNDGQSVNKSGLQNEIMKWVYLSHKERDTLAHCVLKHTRIHPSNHIL
jgi:hypothetical protein